MDGLRSQGIRFAEVTLHVGLDTFAPVTEADPEDIRSIPNGVKCRPRRWRQFRKPNNPAGG